MRSSRNKASFVKWFLLTQTAGYDLMTIISCEQQIVRSVQLKLLFVYLRECPMHGKGHSVFLYPLKFE